MKETENPPKALPTSIKGMERGNLNKLEGPNIIRDMNDIVNANYVRYTFGTNLLMYPTNGALKE